MVKYGSPADRVCVLAIELVCKESANGKATSGEKGGHHLPIPVMAEGNRYRVNSLEELSADEIDCLLFPGGYSPDVLRLHAGTLELVRECHQRGIALAAICHGPWVLISAGIMGGRQATGYVAVRDDLVNAGAEFVDVPAGSGSGLEKGQDVVGAKRRS